MSKNVLVATPAAGFGELIRLTLEDTDLYRVALVDDFDKALALARQESYILAVLDSDLVNPARLGEQINALAACQAEMKLVIVPPENNPEHPLLQGLKLDGFLTKPFYLPDLLDTVEETLGTARWKLQAEPHQPMPRQTSPELHQAPPAPAHQPARRSTAPLPALIRQVGIAWLDDAQGAAAQLMKLSLGTAAQACMIVRSRALWAYAGELPQPAVEQMLLTVDHHWARHNQGDLVRYVTLSATGGEYLLYATDLGSGYILGLLFEAEVPFSQIRGQAGSLARALLNPETVVPAPPAAPTAAAAESKEITPAPAEQTVEPAPAVFERLAVGAIDLQRTGAQLALEPAAQGLAHLVYAFVLVPRLPQHALAGDLAERLSEWIGQFCLAFGWKLVYLTIQPDHLHWMVKAPPAVSPGYVLKMMRRHTSKRIFGVFSRLYEENPSGDFWSQGFLVFSDAQPLSADQIQAFISQERTRQGTRAAH